MPKFHYKAARASGEAFEGTVDVPDRFAVYGEVRKEGGSVLSITEEHKGLSMDVGHLLSPLARVRTSEKIMFARNLGAMLSAGLPLSRALSVLERQAHNQKFRETLAAVGADIKEGKSFHEALARFPGVFPNLFIAMVRAGEESGKLADGLAVVAEQMERSYLLTKKIRGAMIYPGVILSLMAVIGVAMLIFVVPTLTATFAEFDVELPLLTRLIVALSDWLVAHTLLATAGGLAAAFGLTSLARTTGGRRLRQEAVLRLPILKTFTRELNSARTTRTLSSLLTSGVPFLEALGITREVVQHERFREIITRAEESVAKGKPIAKVFMEHGELYPPFVGELMDVGEETGQLPAMLLRIATFYENEVEQRTKNLSTIIEPALMVVIGLSVLVFALSVIQPIYSLSSAL